jgi:BASS family bile acid:Na+ symporter
LRIVKKKGEDSSKTGSWVYLVRKLSGDLLILSVPENIDQLDSSSPYFNLDSAFESKTLFKLKTMEKTIAGETYTFAQLVEMPEQLLMDRLFKICIILMLFFVMVGMGMTLTYADFALVFSKPRGIIIGQILVFGLMPLLAMIFGRIMGFYENYPFIFVGLILITATPGGVTSNLMTYYGKGDLALSISMTSFSTVFSLIFTPLLLSFYCANMPEIIIPVKVVIQTIMILVIIPLIVGMLFRWKWSSAAKKATPFFSALGIIALLVLIIAGILSNLNIFVDTARYGFAFYSVIFALTLVGMMLGIVFSKIFGIDNFQARAISIETGLRNSALAMTLALLLQDSMGDFFSSMFVTAGIFGLVMYVSGIISIYLYQYILPVETKSLE